MSELSEFLLARIGEDEAPTWELVPYSCEPDCCAPAGLGFVGHRCLICNTEEFGGTPSAITEIATEHDERIHRRSRVLAECAAKRAIVTMHDEEPTDTSWDVLHLLALPYADHPDCRGVWAP